MTSSPVLCREGVLNSAYPLPEISLCSLLLPPACKGMYVCMYCASEPRYREFASRGKVTNLKCKPFRDPSMICGTVYLHME